MEERKSDPYDPDGDNTSDINDTSVRPIINSLNTPKKLFISSLPKEVYMINKTMQFRDLLQNSTDDEKLIIYEQMEEEHQIHAQNPTLLNTPQIPTHFEPIHENHRQGICYHRTHY
jgi:hypothetical protein